MTSPIELGVVVEIPHVDGADQCLTQKPLHETEPPPGVADCSARKHPLRTKQCIAVRQKVSETLVSQFLAAFSPCFP